MNIESFFKSKDELAKQEINRDGLAVALCFQSKRTPGMLLATRTNAEEPKFETIGIPMGNDTVAAFILMGSGYQHDFQKLVEVIERYTRITFSTLRHPLALSEVDALELLTDTIAEKYKDMKSKAFGVDLLYLELRNTISKNLTMKQKQRKNNP